MPAGDPGTWGGTVSYSNSAFNVHVVETNDFGEIVVHRGNVTGRLRPKTAGDSIHLNNKYL